MAWSSGPNGRSPRLTAAIGWTIVDDRYVEHEQAATWLRALVDAQGRSAGTARAYAGRLALYLTWAATVDVEPVAPEVDQLAAFARWLERTPSRKHRPGRERRRAVDPKLVVLGSARSAATVEGILAAVVEFVRFAASRGWCEPTVAERLSFRAELRFLPPGWDRGERTGRPTVNRRVVRRRRVESPPATLTVDQVGALVDACSSCRDRFVVEALYATGLRVAELCGLHLADLHLVPSAVHLGCRVAGAHVHVLRREDNENGALAKSIWPRVVPVTRDLVLCHDALLKRSHFSGTGWVASSAPAPTSPGSRSLLDQLEQRGAELEADNHRQRQRIAQLDSEVRELTETLDAARAMNRELMGEINRQSGEGGARPGPRRHS